jgi:hypothetical protein
MLDIWAEFATGIFLHLSIDVLQNGRVEELVNIMSFIFMRLHVLIDWLDNHIHKKPITVDICWISKRCMRILSLVCNNVQQ